MFGRLVASLALVCVINFASSNASSLSNGLSPAYDPISSPKELQAVTVEESVAPAWLSYYFNQSLYHCNGYECSDDFRTNCCGTTCCDSGKDCCDSDNICVYCNDDEFTFIDDDYGWYWECGGISESTLCFYQGGITQPNGCCGDTCCYGNDYCCSHGTCVECGSETTTALAAGAIAGIVIGSVVGCVLLSVLIWWLVYRRHSAGAAYEATPTTATAVDTKADAHVQMQTMKTGTGAGAGAGASSAAAPGVPPMAPVMAGVAGLQEGQIVQGTDGQQYVMMTQPQASALGYAAGYGTTAGTPAAYSTSPQMFGVAPGAAPTSANM